MGSMQLKCDRPGCEQGMLWLGLYGQQCFVIVCNKTDDDRVILSQRLFDQSCR